MEEKAEECIVRASEGIKDFEPISRDLFENLLRLQFINELAEELRKIEYEEAREYRVLMERAARR
mgnify:CR=1 FL=1